MPWKKSLLFCGVCGPTGRARSKTAGKFSLNFAKFSENFPHVPFVGKARQGFFDNLLFLHLKIIRPVLDGLGQVPGFYVFAAGKVCDGAGHL